MNRIQELKKLDKPTLLAIAQVSGGDGHSIFDGRAYVEAGMPEDLVRAFTHTFKSDTSDPKYTIFGRDGKVLPELGGVYGLDVVEAIVAALNLEQSFAMGRGFRAQHCIRVITEACK